MNRLWLRPWFFPGLGAFLYLTGMNDELLHRIGNWWLDFGRWVQTAVVLVVLVLIAYFVLDRFNRRRSAYRTALQPAGINDPPRPNERCLNDQSADIARRSPEHSGMLLAAVTLAAACS